MNIAKNKILLYSPVKKKKKKKKKKKNRNYNSLFGSKKKGPY